MILTRPDETREVPARDKPATATVATLRRVLVFNGVTIDLTVTAPRLDLLLGLDEPAARLDQ